MKLRTAASTWYFAMGWALLALYTLQAALAWQWPLLAVLQENEFYKWISGSVLVVWLLNQWQLSLLRMGGDLGARSQLQQHKSWGAWTPLLFYFHAQTLGYGFNRWLGVVFLVNVGWGLCNRESLKVRSRAFYTVWLVGHVALSMALTMLLGLHIYNAFYYE